MKIVEVSPIFKKQADMIKTNYRPVSILSIFFKRFETIVAEQLRAYLENIFNNFYMESKKSMDVNICL